VDLNYLNSADTIDSLKIPMIFAFRKHADVTGSNRAGKDIYSLFDAKFE
jgi:hypothetical protein